MTDAGVLDPGALETNRAGRLTDAQRAGWARSERSWSGELRGIALVLVAIGVLVLVAADRLSADARLLVAAGFIAAAGVLGWLSLVGRPGLERDLREGRLTPITGAIGRYRIPGARSQPPSYFLEVAGGRYACGFDAYEMGSEPGIVRLYVLPRSGRVVNVERLPDRPLPAGALDAPASALAAAAGRLAGDGAERSEAMATMAAVAHAMLGSADVAAAAEAPPDPRPLAEAILGTWRSPMLRVTFAPDGTARATLANGTQLAGRWSVGADRRLVVSGMGGAEATDARVAADTLTLIVGGTPVALRREAG